MPNNLTTKFFLKPRTQEATKTKAPIIMRLTVDRKKAEFRTGYLCLPAQFDEKRQRAKKDPDINRGLSRLEELAFNFRDRLANEDKPISAAIIRDHLLGKDKDNQSLLSFYRRYLANAEQAGQHAHSTLKGYNQAYRYVELFVKEQYQVEDVAFNQVDYNFVKAFDHFLKTYQTDSGNGRLMPATIKKAHGRFRTLLIEAENTQLIDRHPYRSFKIGAEAPKPKYLSKDELRSLEELDLSELKSLDKVRDMFVFRCYTGLRDDDARHLLTQHIVEKSGHLFIELEQRKTKSQVLIPILPKALEIIEKYNNTSERKIKGLVLPVISNQKQNAYLKTLADLAGIEKRVTTHVARHTCASTVLIANGVPLNVVKDWLGQLSIKSTEIYGHVDQSVLISNATKVASQINSV